MYAPRAISMAIVAFLVLAGGPGCTPSPQRGRMVVLGVDGLDPRVLAELVAEGALPSFERLLHEGAFGRLATFEAGLPPLSPRIWTTVATGRLPNAHGIQRFVRVDAAGVRRLYSGRERRVPAVWEIATAAGRRVGVVNWWFSYPAEPVAGFVISDRFFENRTRHTAEYFDATFERDPAGLVHPASLVEPLDALCDEVADVARTPDDAERIDRSVFDLAYAGLGFQDVDLLLVYTRALDELSHLNWHTHERLPGEPEQPDAIEDYMRRYDRLLGALLAQLAPEDHLMILSDHGFERALDPNALPGTHVSRASAHGTLILHGPRIRPGMRLRDRSMLDALPTMLELSGIPPSIDLPGRVIREAFLDRDATLLARVAPYPRLAVPEASDETVTAAERESIERLRSLGYIE